MLEHGCLRSSSEDRRLSLPPSAPAWCDASPLTRDQVDIITEITLGDGLEPVVAERRTDPMYGSVSSPHELVTRSAHLSLRSLATLPESGLMFVEHLGTCSRRQLEGATRQPVTP